MSRWVLWALRMRSLAALFGSLLIVGCSTSDRQPTPGLIAAELAPMASIQELMQDEVDPSADALWDAVGTITTESGSEERLPRTDRDWSTLRRHAIVLVEATNLLLIPHRPVARLAFPSDGPGVFGSDEIEQHQTINREEFDSFALLLRTQALQMLAAVDARDPAALWHSGEALDRACEACHRANWYPGEVIPSLPSEPPVVR